MKRRFDRIALWVAVLIVNSGAVCFCPSAIAAIALLDPPRSAPYTSAGAALSGNFTVSTNATVLVVGVSIKSGTAPSTLTWNSAPTQPLLQAVDAFSQGTKREVAIYYLYSPTPGTFKVSGLPSASYNTMNAFTLTGTVTTGTPGAGHFSPPDVTSRNPVQSSAIAGVTSGSWALAMEPSNVDVLVAGVEDQITGFTFAAAVGSVASGTPVAGWQDISLNAAQGTGTGAYLLEYLSPGSTIVTGTILPTGGTNYVRSALGAVVFAPAAGSLTSTWSGTNGNWSTAGNWSPASVPASGATENLVFQGTIQISPNDDIAGTYTLNSITHTSTFNGANTLSANTNNTIQFGGASPVLIQNGSAALNISAPLSLSANTVFAGSGTGSVAVSGALSGTGTLTAIGSYLLSLSANSASYSGAVSINAGNLQVRNTAGSATGTGAVTIASGATLSGTGTLSTNAQATNPVTLANGANLAPGTAAAMGTLHIGAAGSPTNLVLNSGTNLAFRCGSPGTSDQVAVTGNLTLSGTLTVTNSGGITAGTYTLFTYTGTVTNNTVTISGVPNGLLSAISTTTANQVNLVLTFPPLALFQFTSGLPVTPTLFPVGTFYPPTSEYLSVAATISVPVADLTLTTSSEAGTGGVVPANAPFLKANPAGNATTPAAALQGTYFEISATPATGAEINCTTLTFNTACGGDQPSGFVIRSNLDNFTANLAQQDVPTVRPVYTPVSVDLSGALFQNLATKLTFRIYCYSPTGGQTVDFDDISLNGGVAQAITWQPPSGNWSAAANWLPAAVPANSTATSLLFQGTAQFTSNDDLAGMFTLNTITHTGTFGGTNTITAGAGNGLQFAGTGRALFQNGSAALAISAPINLTANTVFGGTGSGSVVLTGVLGGTGALTKSGSYLLSLSADSSAGYSGAVSISSGTLQVLNTSGSATGTNAVSIASGATLSGNGIIGTSNQSVSTLDGTVVSPGTSAAMGTLHIGAAGLTTNLILTPNTLLNFRCGALGNNDAIAVTGNLFLGGSLTVTNAGGMVGGTYTLFTYTGTLTNNALSIASLPSGFVGVISTSTLNQVNLVLQTVTTAAVWTGQAGDGKWSTATNWVNSSIPSQTATTTITFPDLGAPYTVNNDIGPFVLNQIVVASGQALGITGGALQFSGTAPSIMQNGAGAVTLSNNLVLAATTTFGGTGSGDTTIGGVISESTPSAVVKSGSTFNLFFNAANLYSGGTTINGGTLTVATESGLGLSNSMVGQTFLSARTGRQVDY